MPSKCMSQLTDIDTKTSFAAKKKLNLFVKKHNVAHKMDHARTFIGNQSQK